jgi:hypothetical protein
MTSDKTNESQDKQNIDLTCKSWWTPQQPC